LLIGRQANGRPTVEQASCAEFFYDDREGNVAAGSCDEVILTAMTKKNLLTGSAIPGIMFIAAGTMAYQRVY
jgi:hypothetical protein